MASPLTALLVDDSPHDRGMVRRELRREFDEIQFVEATNEVALGEALEAARFDLVVTDYRIRWTDGLKVLQAVKARLPDCPVLMFTATGSEDVAVEAMKSGLDDYVIKNVNHLVRLRGAARAALANAATRKRANRLASRLERLLSQLKLCFFSCNDCGKFVERSEQMTALFQPNDSDPSYDSLHSFFVSEAEADRFLQTVCQTKSQDIELEVRNSQGETKFYRLSATVIEAPGEELRIDGLMEDITRRRQMERDAQQSAVAIAQISMLSPREYEVLREVTVGSPNKAIARRLEISEKTVEKHRANMMRKLQVRSVAELVRLAMLAESAGPS